MVNPGRKEALFFRCSLTLTTKAVTQMMIMARALGRDMGFGCGEGRDKAWVAVGWWWVMLMVLEAIPRLSEVGELRIDLSGVFISVFFSFSGSPAYSRKCFCCYLCVAVELASLLVGWAKGLSSRDQRPTFFGGCSRRGETTLAAGKSAQNTAARNPREDSSHNSVFARRDGHRLSSFFMPSNSNSLLSG